MKYSKKYDLEEFLKEHEVPDDDFPRLTNLSAAFFYDILPNPKERKPIELIQVNIPEKNFHETLSPLLMWNNAWEAGQFRPDICYRDLPKKFQKLIPAGERNIYFIPKYHGHSYGKYALLHHLLPLEEILKNDLPFVENANWPIPAAFPDKRLFKDGYDAKLEKAFANYIWRFLDPRSSLKSFSDDDPIKVLAHNLDYWIGPAYNFVEKEVLSFNHVPDKGPDAAKRMEEILKDGPFDDVNVHYPRYGGPIWFGKEQALQATSSIVDIADKAGRLREILDLVRSNRIQDDFSSKWSWEKEDFERKLYHKRHKVKVSFVELDETVPIISPDSEIDENLMWEDFMALLDPKEKKITVCLRNGETKLKEIAEDLGYSNHSPVSKALQKIREKASFYFENSR